MMKLIRNFFKNILSEFQLKNFCFEHNEVDQFFRSQWQTGQCSFFYLLYRWISALFFIGVFSTCLALQFCEGKLFIFLTNWGIIFCLVTQVLAAILVTRWHFDIGGIRSTQARRLPIDYLNTVTIENGIHNHSKTASSITTNTTTTTTTTATTTTATADGDENASSDNESLQNLSKKSTSRIPFLVKLYWMLHSVALSLGLVITIIYWTFLNGKMDKPQNHPTISFVTHCLNSVFMGMDFLIVAFPMRILHMVYVMALTILYCVFTVIYYLCGGRDEFGNPYVYPILYWKYPGKGMTTFAGVFCLYIIIAIILFAIFKIKRMIHQALTQWNPHAVGLY